jgi:hypothetical protein
MKLFKILRKDRVGYDEFDSAIVAAQTAEKARKIVPVGNNTLTHFSENGEGDFTFWTNDIKNVKVEYIGEAKSGQREAVILASFNAG